MTVAITSLDDVSATTVQQIHAELTELLQEQHPEVEVSLGVIHTLVLYFSAVFEARVQQELDRYLQARSLQALEENPELAETALVDDVLSNYRLTRHAGQAAQGTITVIVEQDLATVIPSGLQWSANGQTFTANAAYVARETTATLTGANEVNLVSRGDGTYQFSMPATCTATGPDGNLRQGTSMVPATAPGNFVAAYAGSDFAGGVALETNTALLARMREGIAAKAWSNADNIVALIKEQEEFEDTLDYSIVGYPYPEQLRDQHGALPVSGGGKTDIYCRTAATPTYKTIQKQATYIGNSTNWGLWQVTFDRDEAPGFYEVSKILLPTDDPDSSGFEILLDTRQINFDDDDYAPDIDTAVEVAYSRYQTVTVQFVDDETSFTDLVAGTSKKTYNCVVSQMPQVKALQDFISGWEVRDPAGDALIKAAIPCFLSVNIEIQQARTETAPTTATIQSAVADAVNRLGFPGQLHGSTVADVVHNYLSRKQAIKRLDLHGRIRRPDGEMVYLRDSQRIEIPHDPLNLITGRTVAFILDPADVAVTVLTEGYTDRL